MILRILFIKYYYNNYRKYEYFAYNYKFSSKIDKYINFINKEKWTFYQIIDKNMNDNYFNYNILNSSFFSYSNIDLNDIINLISIYKFNYNEILMILNDDIIFKKFFIYNIILDEKKFIKMIIDNDIFILYLNEKLVKKMNIEVIKIIS